MSRSVDLKAPELFTAAAVGPPGQRVFYLQALEAGLLVTLKIEKEQVDALAEYLAQLLDKSPGEEGDVPGDLMPREPIEAAWTVGSLGIALDETAERIVLVAEELSEEEDTGREPASARLRLTRGQARAFVGRARELIRAGRPPCLVCGRPKDPDGHVCPRNNGHLHA